MELTDLFNNLKPDAVITISIAPAYQNIPQVNIQGGEVTQQRCKWSAAKVIAGQAR